MIDIANYLERITELQQAAIPESTAAPVAVYSQGDYPYWTNQLTTVTPSTGMGLEFKRYDITIVMTLHRGKVLSGERTQLERQCQSDVFTILSKFLEVSARQLITTNYTTVQSGYQPNTHTLSSNGVVFISTNDTATDMGTQYTLQFAHIDRS